jgi:hypothetical protein
MKKIASDIIYKSKSIDIVYPPWKQNFCFEVYYDWKNLSFRIMIIRYIEYPHTQLRSINYQTPYLFRKDIQPNLLAPYLNKYGFRFKYLKIFHKQMNLLQSYYNRRIKVLTLLLSHKLPEFITQNIIIYLV